MNPYLGFSALLMAGLDGVENKIHPGEAGHQGPVPPAAGRRRQDPHRLPQPRTGAGVPGQGPRLPHQGWRVHRQLPRRLHRPEDAGSDALPHGHAPGRVRHVLLACNRQRRYIHATKATARGPVPSFFLVRDNPPIASLHSRWTLMTSHAPAGTGSPRWPRFCQAQAQEPKPVYKLPGAPRCSTPTSSHDQRKRK